MPARIARSRESDVCSGAAAVAATAVSDAAGRTQIQVDVAVRSAGTPDEPGRVLSLGEAKWGEVMGLDHLARLRRARDLLS